MNRNGQILGRGITLFAVIITVFLIVVGFLAMTYFISLGKSSKEIFNVESFNGESVFLLLENMHIEGYGQMKVLDAVYLLSQSKIEETIIKDHLIEQARSKSLINKDVKICLILAYNSELNGLLQRGYNNKAFYISYLNGQGGASSNPGYIGNKISQYNSDQQLILSKVTFDNKDLYVGSYYGWCKYE